MDQLNAVSVGAGIGAMGSAAYASQHFDQSLVLSNSALTLESQADIALDVKARHQSAPTSFPDFEPRHWSHIADQIEHGYSDMSGKAGPNRYQAPAAAPLRRASGMELERGVTELRAAANTARQLETAALRQVRGGLIATGALVALGVGVYVVGGSR